MLNEDEVFQAIHEFAVEKYGQVLESLWERYDRKHPLSLIPPGEPRHNDFICHVIFELPFTDNGVTIAEEFANVSKDIDSKMKDKIMKMKYMITYFPQFQIC